MRPLFITFLQLDIGGVQRKIIDLVNYLGKVKPSLPIFIILRNNTLFNLNSEIKNKNVVILNYSNSVKIKLRFFFPFYFIFLTLKYNPSSILSFLDYCSLPAIVAKYLFFWKKIKVVISEDHYTSGVLPNLDFSKTRNILIKIFYPLSDKIIVCSEANKKDLINNYRINPNKIRIINNWTLFSDNSNIKRGPKTFDLAYIGRLEKTKNLTFLLRCVSKINKYRNCPLSVLIMGSGKEKDNLIKLSKRLRIEKKINFIESNKNVVKYLKSSKIFVYTSDKKVEGLPMALLEAMSLNVPVVTRDFYGIEEFFINGKDCLMFSTKKEFISSIIKLLDNPKLAKNISNNAIKKIKENHSSKNISEYLDELGLLNI